MPEKSEAMMGESASVAAQLLGGKLARTRRLIRTVKGVVPADDGRDYTQRLIDDLGDLVGKHHVRSVRKTGKLMSKAAVRLVKGMKGRVRAVVRLEVLLAVRDDPSQLLASGEDLSECGIDHWPSPRAMPMPTSPLSQRPATRARVLREERLTCLARVARCNL